MGTAVVECLTRQLTGRGSPGANVRGRLGRAFQEQARPRVAARSTAQKVGDVCTPRLPPRTSPTSQPLSIPSRLLQLIATQSEK